MHLKRFDALLFLSFCCFVACLGLSGCDKEGNTSRKQALEDTIVAPIENERTPTKLDLDGGELELYLKAPCSFKYTKAGVKDFERDVNSAESGRVIYARPTSNSGASGPDLIVEWTYKGDYNYALVLCAGSEVKISNVIETGTGHLKISENKAHEIDNAEFDCIFPELGGAHQVIVPMKLRWRNDRFVISRPTKHRRLSPSQFAAKVQDARAPFARYGGDAISAELAEDVLQLIYEDDKKDARRLLHVCRPRGSDESKLWKTLCEALEDASKGVTENQL